MLGSPVVQEAISRVSSFISSKREEESREHNIERLEMASTELELAIERSGKLPITDVSLLRRRKILKRALQECSDILRRCKLRAQQDQETEQGRAVRHSSFPKRVVCAAKSSIAYFLTSKKDNLSCSDVRRFEWFADCAGKFVRDVEHGCSLRQHTFCNPLVRHLLEGRTLRYEMVQGSHIRDIYMWPLCLENRGVEAELSYQYENFRMPERNFHLRLWLRLSESTDIVGAAVKCLQCLASQFMLAAECAIGELTLLPDLHDISHSNGAPWLGIQDSYTRLTRICRPDPTCCRSNGHERCPDNTVSSELSSKTGEEVISVNFHHYTSAQEHNLRSSTDEGRSRPAPLKVTAGFVPHGMWGDLARNYELEVDERRDENIEQVIEMVRWKTMDRLIRQPGLPYHMTLWQYAHGFAVFQVRSVQKPYRPHHDEDHGHDLDRCKKQRRYIIASYDRGVSKSCHGS
ncbi:hypothetical protein C2845_PM03G02190 [Panicum miliaceum]|uniref:Uncharacterized protein n=1 Tax=Panicum miliaceum TaxID=4540 RepID=A0A3L6TFL0_PANMI|nr:hypothetical protein C2845_PM03G02190 [Panicum miliaceum]